MIDDAVSSKALQRLRKIEGQIKGIQRMVEDHRYCMDVITQISAAESALHKLSELILKNHVETCVLDAFRSGDSNQRKKKIDELMEAYSRCRAR